VASGATGVAFCPCTTLHHAWILYKSSATDDHKLRTATCTNNKYLPSVKVTQVSMNTSDAITIEIQTTGGKTTLIINIYNSNNESTVILIKDQLI